MKKTYRLLPLFAFFISSLVSSGQIFHPLEENDWYLNFDPAAIEFIDLNMDGSEEVLTWFDDPFDDEYYINQNESGYFGSYVMGFGDFNEDGFLDMISTGNSFGLGISLSDNTKSFGDSDFYTFFNTISNSQDLTSGLRATIGDFNGDDNLDIIAVQFDNSVFKVYRTYFYAGDGTGGFAEPTQVNPLPSSVLESADFNDDGDLDLIIDTGIYPGGGDATFDFENELIAFSLSSTGPVLADVNDDDRMDILTDISGSSNLHLILNNGSSVPTISDLGFNPITSDVGDYDGDGNIDIYDIHSPYDQVQLGDGAGNFSPSMSAFYPPSSIEEIYLADNNGDGTTDLLYIEDDRLYLSLSNPASNRFEGMLNVQRLRKNETYTDTELVDVSGDGYADLVATFSDSLMIMLNDGNGNLLSPSYHITSENPLSLLAVDINDDEAIDLIVGCNSSDNNNFQVFANNGSGGFGLPTSMITSSNIDLTPGDFNGDGELDIAGVTSGGVSIFFGDGEGGFNNPVVSNGPSSPDDIEVADYNGDGNIDIVIARGSRIYGLDGDGAGNFNYDVNNYQSVSTRTIETGDVNNDGVDDIVTISTSNQYTTYFGAADTNIQDLNSVNSSSSFTDNTRHLTAADFNSDGNLDVVREYRGNRLFLGMGTGEGTFIEYEVPLTGDNSNFSEGPIAVGDINADGMMDAIHISQRDGLNMYAYVLVNSFQEAIEPTVQASSALASDVASDAATVSWTPGDGAGSFVLISENSLTESIPVDFDVSNIKSSQAYPFSGATQFGDAYVIYDGDSDMEVNLTDLPINTEFNVAVYSYNGTTVDRNYLQTNPATTSFTTLKGDQEVVVTEADMKEFQYEPFTPAFTINSGLEVNLSIVSGPAEINEDGEIQLTGLGDVVYAIDQAGDDDWNALTTVQETINILKGNQTINFFVSATTFIHENNWQLPVYTTNDLPITYTIDQGAGSLITSGDTTFYVWDGETNLTITATQAGDDFVNAASPAVRSTFISKQDQTISWGLSEVVLESGLERSRLLDGETIQFQADTLQLNATSTSGLPVTYIITQGPGLLQGIGELSRFYIYNSNAVGTGTVTISAAAQGNDVYNSAIPEEVTFTIVKGDQVISFATQFPDPVFSEGLKYELGATSNSGLEVSYEQISGSGMGTIENDSIYISQAGSFNIQASQAGNQNWNAATSVSRSFAISKGSQTITIDAVENGAVGDVFELSYTVSSGLGATVQSSTGRSSINGNTITLNVHGEETLNVYNNGDENYDQVVESVSFCISPGKPSITQSGNQLFASVQADEIKWSLDGELLATLSPNTGLDLVGSGSYTAIGAASNCPDGEVSDPFEFALGLNDLSFSIYPNPTSDVLYFGVNEPLQINLFSLDGKEVLSEFLTGQKVDISRLKEGQYILHIHRKETLLGVKKIIKVN